MVARPAPPVRAARRAWSSAIAVAVCLLAAFVTASTGRAAGLPAVQSVGEPQMPGSDTQTFTSPTTPGNAGCSADGSCVVVTRDSDPPGAALYQTYGDVGYVESAGAWTGPQQLPMSGRIAIDGTAAAQVTCPSGGPCLVMNNTECGQPDCPENNGAVLVDSEAAGTFSQQGLIGGGSDNQTGFAIPDNDQGVGCTSSADCTVVGAQPDYVEAPADSIAGGAMHQVATTGPFQSIGCAQNGPCAANDGAEPMFKATGGTWGAPTLAPFPSGATNVALDSDACTATTCYADGTYDDSSGDNHPTIFSTTDGTWTLDETADALGGYAGLACPTNGACVATGSAPYDLPSLSDASGSWAPLTGGTADLANLNGSFVCTTSGPCMAATTTGDVLEESAGVVTAVAHISAPADCSDAQASADGDPGYCESLSGEISACAANGCTFTAEYPDGDNDIAYAFGTINAVAPNPPVVNSTADGSAENGGANGCNTGNTVTVNGVSQPECTLRAAIQAENAGSVTQKTITFALPASGGSTISPKTALPSLSAAGVTVSGAGVTLDGGGMTAIGLELAGANDTATGLAVTNWTTGVQLDSPGGGDVASGMTVSGTTGSSTPTRGIIIEGSPNATVGGSSAASRDTIDAEGVGVLVEGAKATGATVAGDRIGTTVGVGDGVLDIDASGVTVGGSTTSAGVAPGNAIDALGGVVGANTQGVAIGGDAATVTGATVTGNVVKGGSQNGVLVAGSVQGATVSANTISGATGADVDVDGTSVAGTQVLGNTIGVQNIAAAQFGVDIQGASHTTVSGHNVITGATVGGVQVVTTTTKTTLVASGDVLPGTTSTQTSSTGASIADNVIGPLADGRTLPTYEQHDGVVLDGIGDTLGSANEISGNDVGVADGGTGESVIGDQIGVDPTGLRALPNAFGVVVVGKQDRIGAPGARPNTISGNEAGEIFVTKAATGAVIQNNLIGTTTQGESAIAPYQGTLPFKVTTPGPGINVAAGIAGTTVIGGPSPTAGNVISGNVNAGITIGSPAVVQSNRIGVAANTGSAIPNDGPGVLVTAPSTIGADPDAPTKGGGNLVADNAHGGIHVLGGGHPTSMLSDLVFANHDFVISLTGLAFADDPPPYTVGAVLDPSRHGTRVQVTGRDLAAGDRVQVFRSPDACTDNQDVGTTALLATARITKAPQGVATVTVPVRTPAVGTGVTAVITRGRGSLASSSEIATCSLVGVAAKVDSVAVDGANVELTVDCTSKHPCADVVIEETIPAGRSGAAGNVLADVHHRGGHRHGRTRTVVIARVRLRLRAHHRRTVLVRLDAAGRRRLRHARHRRLTATLRVTSHNVALVTRHVRLAERRRAGSRRHRRRRHTAVG